MRSTTVLTLLSAGMAAATPLHQVFHKMHKKAYVTDIVTDIVMVTVTAGAPQAAPTTTSQAAPKVQTFVKTVVVGPSEAAPAPSSTSSAAQVKVVTQAAAKPSTTQAAAAKPSSTTAAAASNASPTDYASTAVYNHNQHRANHTASNLAYNQTLADWALITANKCVFAHDMSEGTANYGQNIAAYGASNSVPSQTAALANAITDMWYYGEVNEFPFGEASPCTTCGTDFLHFSQAVWKNTQTVGCATVQCGPNTVLGSNTNYDSMFTVCNYFPAGNFMGEFNTQVTKSTDSVGTLIANI